MKKLPADVQSLFGASIRINNFKSAIKELVYNSLDAESSSIAIRVHIQGHSIQVIDNGCGVSKDNLNLLGHKYMTSKFIDLSTLKSAPNKYGFRGQALANIIEVSQNVTITSRCDKADTWIKTFFNGKERKIAKAPDRPAKGTTVEIRGFLYNRNIQKKSIVALFELNDIKTFLEQLSLIHPNVSLSLRDDSKNEIIFKLHKSKDIYQTFSTLFGINETDLQELKVEKNQYKVTAYIGKKYSDLCLHYQWIYLNRIFLFNSKLHKAVNNNLNKYIYLEHQTKKNAKTKNLYGREDNSLLNKNSMLFYFIFVTCPYYDYDVSYTPRCTGLEFKNWAQINLLLEKLVKLYVGDINLKEITKTDNIQIENKGMATRDQVKKIMEKFLGSNSKKPGVSQMQHGVKGKILKRKFKKKPVNINFSNLIPENGNDYKSNEPDPAYASIVAKSNTFRDTDNISTLIKKNPKKTRKRSNINIVNNKQKLRIVKNHGAKIATNKIYKPLLKDTGVYTSRKNCKLKNNSLVRNFERETDTVMKRCNMLANKVEDLLSYTKKRRQNVFINETVQYSNIIRNEMNVSIQKKIGEYIIHDYTPLSPNFNAQNTDNFVTNQINKKSFKSSYSLLQTIIKSQKINYMNKEINAPSTIYRSFDFRPICSELNHTLNSGSHPVLKHTFESHKNHRDKVFQLNKFNDYVNKTKNIHFISNISRENFIVLNMEQRLKKQYKNLKTRSKRQFRPNDVKKPVLSDTSYSIDFSKGNENKNFLNKHTKIIDGLNLFDLTGNDDKNETYIVQNDDTANSNICNTYTITTSNTANFLNNTQYTAGFDFFQAYSIPDYNGETYCNANNITRNSTSVDQIIKEFNLQQEQKKNDMNVVFISKSQHSNIDDKSDGNLDPLNVCEPIFSSFDLFENEFELPDSFNSNRCENPLYNGKSPDIMVNSNSPHDLYQVMGSLENVSRHFNGPSSGKFNTDLGFEDTDVLHVNNKNIDYGVHSSILTFKSIDVKHKSEQIIKKGLNQNLPFVSKGKTIEVNNFDLKNRLNFVPKGMSPIFENCNSKAICDYHLDKDYFEHSIYNNFANDVQINSEIFEPRIQNVNELPTNAKVNNKLDKEKASLIFNGLSLDHATVLGQVDEKFIAATIKGEPKHSDKTSVFLVLFDQHAVHERITLEKNLAEYLIGDQWKSISLDNFTLKLSNDEVLYLHNYKEKFAQFGLQWSISNNNEISIHAIPEAILGSSNRQVEIVIKAVKNLISEEIRAIKNQKGCVALHPKSIMDLIFSEACRHAIKFGEKLSFYDCIELLKALSKCKTPFQCAHGRPVMAVIMELRTDNCEYKINPSRIIQYNKKLRM